MKTRYIISFLTIILISVPLFSQENQQEDLFHRASVLFFQKRFIQAEPLLKKVITADPKAQKAYSYLGDIYLNQKKYKAALEMYKESTALEPKNGADYFRLGQVYYFLREPGPAIESFSRSVELDTSLSIAYFHIGLTYLMLKRDKENTIVNWEIFLRKRPDDPQYMKIKRAIELLKGPTFMIPAEGSDDSIRKALRLGGVSLRKVHRRARDKGAGQEKKKTKEKIEDIYLDDDM